VLALMPATSDTGRQ